MFESIYKRQKKAGFKTSGPSLTQQGEKKACDINNILKRYKATGVLPQNMHNNPIYGDFSNAEDFQTSLQIVQTAMDQFNLLPSSVRDRFRNSPAEFLAFVNDKKNSEELIKMGLAKAIPISPPVLSPVSKPDTTTPLPAESTKGTK